MMKKSLIAFTFLFLTTIAHAEFISKYIVQMTVLQSGKIEIVENIYYDFEDENRHGIYRFIPQYIKHGYIERDINIDSINVNMDKKQVESFVVNSGENIKIIIGDENKLITGKHLYVISYRVNLGVVLSANELRDAIRFNLIGTQWKVPIKNIKAFINLPKSINKDSTKLKTYSGSRGSTSTNAVSTWQDQKIVIDLNELDSYEGLTVEIEFNKNTLEQSGAENLKPTWFEKSLHIYNTILSDKIAILFSFLVMFYARNKYLKLNIINTKRSISPQYYPPEDFSVLQSEYILNGYIKNSAFSSSIIELARKKYIELVQKNKNSTLVLKSMNNNYNNLTQDQRFLLKNVLFKNVKSFKMIKKSKNKAKILSEGFSEIRDFIYSWAEKKMLTNGDLYNMKYSYFMSMVPFILLAWCLTVWSVVCNSDSFYMVMGPFFGVIFSFMIITTTKISNYKIVSGILLGILIKFEVMHSDVSIGSQEYNLNFIALYALLAVYIYFNYLHSSINNLTQEGTEIKNHLLGLKMFIKRVKKDEIERRLKDDPMYIDKLLAYAMIFGEVKHWLKFYDQLNLNKPDWYKGDDMSTISSFSSSVGSVSSYSVSSSSSSSSSSSGGGSGGGGGGSW